LRFAEVQMILTSSPLADRKFWRKILMERIIMLILILKTRYLIL